MATTAEQTAIAVQIKSTDSAIQTYLAPTTGMSAEMLTLVQKAVATTTKDKKGQPYKSFDSEGNFIFVTGFQCSQEVMLSVGSNKQGLPCLNYDEILSSEEKRAIVMARRFKNSTPAVAPATPIAPVAVDANNVNL